MKLLKCADCGKEISITSDKCPNCGSEKQFKGYTFIRKELVNDGLTPTEMMKFQKHGGKIKISDFNYKRFFKIFGITFIVLAIISQIIGMQKTEYTKEDGTVVRVSVNEKLELESIQRDKEREKNLLDTIKSTETFNYAKLEELYASLTKIRKSNQEYMKMYQFYKVANESKKECIRSVHNTDKEKLNFPDSYDIKISPREVGIWISKNKFAYQYEYSGKNAFGMEKTMFSQYTCIYDENFNLINIQKQ